MEFITVSNGLGDIYDVYLQNISHLAARKGYTTIIMKDVAPELATINVKESREEIQKLIAEKRS